MEVKESHLKRSLFFIEALQKVQRQVHPNLHARKDALEYIDSLIQQLLNMLCQSQPHTVTDVEDCVKKTFPHPIDKWAIGDANTALEKGKKKSPLVLPVEKLHPILVKEVLGYKVDFQVSLYIVAVLEYIAADIFKLAGNYVRNIKHSEITSQDIKVAMCADKVLMDMFFQDDEVSFSVEEEPVKQGSLKYEDIVKDLILEETQHVRDLNMIIKVFRDPFEKLFPKSGDLDAIFSNIFEVYEFSTKLLSSLEDVVEATEENSVPLIGGIFEELAENAEFVVYERYAEDLMKPHGRERLNILLQRKDLKETLDNTGNGFRDAVKYVLPKSLLGPIYHCLHILDVIKTLQSTSPTEEDQESLEQASGLLHQTKLKLDIICKDTLPKRKPGETSLRCYGRMGRQAALNKMNDLQKSIDGWEGKDIAQSSNEFVMDGVVSKYAGKRLTERHVFLFDGLLILCKQNLRRSSVTGPVGEYRLKDKFHLRKLTINDKDDTPEVKNAFEIQLKDQPSMTLVAKSIDEKNNWMWALVSLQKRSFLERMLDSRLLAEEKAQPLRLPSPEHYRFAEEDSEDNIVIDSTSPIGESPVIKGGTLLKLVERLTYHMYADPKFVRTFLTTYRSFCKPQELLKLLMERFEIPDPVLPEEESDSNEASSPTSPSANPANREDLKRFRKEYCKPVQFRVLNVLRHWVDHHYYDYERDESLLTNLEDFLETVKGKAMRKWVESITKVIQRRKQAKTEPKDIVYEKELPPIEWHIARTPDQFDLMQLHPIEIARQVTLLEFDLYRAVKPSELVGSTEKKDKRESAPNLHKMIHFSTMFTFWLEKCIVEAENFEERVAVMSRIIEIMIMFQENNNFSGVLEVVSAMNSAPIHRLEHTRLELPTKLSKALEEACELNSDHLRKYIEKLRSINPPCVPFLGMYLTNILHIEEGNPDILPNKEGIINFSKRRKVAEITGEIQQYQNQPYCLSLEADIRHFFECLNPLGDMGVKDCEDYMYNKSIEIEPRNCRQPPKFVRKTTYPLKSPGIKPSSHQASSRHSSTSGTSTLKRHDMSSVSSPFTFHKNSEEDMEPLVSAEDTPPTPSTPLTPPATASTTTTSNNSVFANVMIGSATGGSSSPSSISSPLQPLPEQLFGMAPLQPPPIPPRRRREQSVNDYTSRGLAPEVPPRDISPPPLPPRREVQHHGTLPRTHSMSYSRSNMTISSHSTLPRRHSERDHINVNGTDSNTPQLPPKTYKYSHSRKPSS